MNEMLILNIVLWAGSFAYHFLAKWGEYNRSVTHVSFGIFWRVTPAMNAASCVAAVVAFVAVHAMGWMNPPAAITCGYAADSLLRRLAEKWQP